MSTGFECTAREPVPALGVVLERYSHAASGATHAHLVSDDPCEAFAVAVRAPITDSSGVAHVLEHLVLSGSRRFPASELFFRVRRGSPAAAMNARTTAEGSHYHFASAEPRDFETLLGVYLDSVFHPLLDPLDFAREGCRIECADPADPRTSLAWRGVVFNEMTGAMAADALRLRQCLLRHLLTGAAAAHNPGGDPRELIGLTHETLVAFHARHFRPANAVFLSAGPRPAAALQRFIERQVLADRAPGEAERLVLARAPAESVDLEVPVQERSPAEAASVLFGWLLDADPTPLAASRAELCVRLLGDDDGPLARLRREMPGARPAALRDGLVDDLHELVLVQGVAGVAEIGPDVLQARLVDALADAAARPPEPARVERALAALELERDRPPPRQPRSLALLLRMVPALLRGQDPLPALDTGATLAGLRAEAADPGWFGERLREWRVARPADVRLRAVPDRDRAWQQPVHAAASARDRGCTPSERESLVERWHRMEARRLATPAPGVVPRLRRSDLAGGREPPEQLVETAPGVHVCSHPASAGDLVTLTLTLPVGAEDGFAAALHRDLLAELAVVAGGRQSLRAALLDRGVALETRMDTAVDPHRRGAFVLHWSLLARCLPGRGERVAELLSTLPGALPLDDLDRLGRAVARLCSRREAAMEAEGHRLAMSAAAVHAGPAARFAEAADGMAALARARRLAAEDAAARGESAGLRAELAALAARLGGARRDWLLAGPGAGAIASRLPPVAGSPRPVPACPGGADGPAPAVRGFTCPTTLNCVAMAWPAPAAGHADAAVFAVLAPLLGEGFLHDAVRGGRGAYGAGAVYDTATASFRLFSYRDPGLADTLSDFRRAGEWAAGVGEPEVEQAVLRAVGQQRPPGPGEALFAGFLDRLSGGEDARQEDRRRALLAVDAEAVRRVAGEWLEPARAGVAAIAPRDALYGAGIEPVPG